MILEANYGGIKLKNPLIVASATPTMTLEGLKKSVDVGAGALVAKSIIFSKAYAPGVKHTPGERCGSNTSPRFAIVNKDIEFDRRQHARGSYYSLFGLMEPYPTPEEWAPVMEKIKKYTDIPIILSVCAADKDYEEWRKIAKEVENIGADAIEVSMHHMPYVNYTNPEIIKVLKETVKVPVIAKPMVPHEDPLTIGPALEASGVDGITAIGNQPLRGFEVNVETEDFYLHPTSYGVRGPWLRPIGLNWILQLARCTNVPLSGVTGISSWKDVIKYILCGASTVQVCTALYVDGYQVITEMINGLENWMNEHGYSNIEEFRGKLVKKWRPPTELDPVAQHKAEITSNCTGCGLCTKVCFFHALSNQDNVAVVDETKCDGCGLCSTICPFKAINMKKVEPYVRPFELSNKM